MPNNRGMPKLSIAVWARMSYQPPTVSHYPIVILAFVMVHPPVARASFQEPGCGESVQAEATTGMGATRFEDAYPVFESSLRARFPRVHRQLMEEYEAAPSILRFAGQPSATPEKASDLMDKMQEGSNALSKRLHKVLRGVEKDLASVEKEVDRLSKRRGHSDGAVALREKREDLIKLQRVLDMAAKFFHLGPSDSKVSLGPGTALKWERFLEQRAELGERMLTEADSRSTWFAEISKNYRWSWDLIRLAFCVPRIERALVKLSDLSGRNLATVSDGKDRYISVKFTDENGVSAVGDLRSFESPVRIKSSDWDLTLSAAEKLKHLAPFPRFKVYFFFVRGIESQAKKALEEMGIEVRGPEVPSEP